MCLEKNQQRCGYEQWGNAAECLCCLAASVHGEDSVVSQNFEAVQYLARTEAGWEIDEDEDEEEEPTFDGLLEVRKQVRWCLYLMSRIYHIRMIYNIIPHDI